jgi:transcription elongation GreA/GreB family factor
MSFSLNRIDKTKLLYALRQQVEAALKTLLSQQRDSQQAATHEENRSEHSKDTRATEQSYLARGLATRVANLRRTSLQLAGVVARNFESREAVAPMALVVIRVEEESEPQIWWLVPTAGGFNLGEAGLPIRTLTPSTPLGRAMLGLLVGDDETFTAPGGQRAFELLEIA